METELYLCQSHLHIASEPLQPVNAEVYLVVISKSNLSGGGKQRPEKRLRLQARATVNQQHIGNKQYYINCVWLHLMTSLHTKSSFLALQILSVDQVKTLTI